MTEEVKAIIGIVGTTIALIFSKNIWKDRKHAREIKAELKAKDEKIEALENEKLELIVKHKKELGAARRRIKKLESY